MYKICNVCGEIKHTSEYHKNKSCKFGVVGTCKTCHKVKVSRWYSDNKTRRQEYSNKRNRDRKREWVVKLGDKCTDCGNSFPDFVYDFHHLDGKDVNPSKALTWYPERAADELSKCILLCSNCHRIRHFGGGEFNETTH